jgi:ring-1,2-phenylacetyl-CoA epoxidase subunit PaaE
LTVTPVAEAGLGHRRATIHPLRVSGVEALTDDSVVIEFEIPAELAGEYAFTHGQHVSLRCEAAGDDVRRSY